MARGRRGGRARDRRRDAAQRTAPARLEARGHGDRPHVRLGLGRLRRGRRLRAREGRARRRPRPSSSRTGSPTSEAWSVGLPCGGEIDVFVEPFDAAPPLERGTSYVVVAGDGLGERWHDDTSDPNRRCAKRTGAPSSPSASRRRRASSRSAPATSPRRSARSRARSAGTRSSSTRAPGSRRVSACRARTRSSSRGPTRSTVDRRHGRRLARARGAARHSRAPRRRRGRSVLRRRARLEAQRRRSAASSSARSPTRSTARSASTSAARLRPRSRSRSSPRSSRLGRASEREQPEPEQQVQPVVGGVHRQPVEATDHADQPEREVRDPAAGQEGAGSRPRVLANRIAAAEREVDDVVQHAHLEERRAASRASHGRRNRGRCSAS